MKWIYAFLLNCLLALQPAWGDGIALRIGPHVLNAEIAATPESRMRGLMQRDGLCAKCGMLFVFPQADRYGFWMRDTPLPLSIAFIAPNGRIINIEDMQPLSSEQHYAKTKALYALEMNRGWFARHGVKAGDRVLGVKNVVTAR
jgi:uncharacterized membrane protein (UPF0127 family)